MMTKKGAPPILSIVGRSGAGKTTLIEKLIAGLKQRGYRVGTVKHHAHPGIDIDRPGKDTWRHAQAGSDHIVIAAPDQVVSIRRVGRAPRIHEIAQAMVDVDIILTDGYRRADTLKIEVMRAERSKENLCRVDELLAVVADFGSGLEVPHFEFDQIEALIDLIVQALLSSNQTQ